MRRTELTKARPLLAPKPAPFLNPLMHTQKTSESSSSAPASFHPAVPVDQRQLKVFARQPSSPQIARQCCWRVFTSHADMFAKRKLPPGSAYRCRNITFKSQPPSLCRLPRENFLTVHPPDLHLPIVSSGHDKRHCRVEGSPVHPTVVALQAKRNVTRSNLLTEWNEQRKDEATKAVDGLAKTQLSPFLYTMLLMLNAHR